ncbi:restriction endonuclease [Sulfitobacter sp. 1A13679]|uniref:restriction endonuclease n=1 Tax=Sulfitobacter sp. 1A13679 TaxID=3368597 RepID=UPI003745676A
MTDVPDWLVYQRVVACFQAENAGMDATVIPNASLRGTISGVQRQIDILVDARWQSGVARRIIYDAKRRNRKINVKDIESFEGMMRDVRANRGVIVCSSGWTEAAEARADQNIEIVLMADDDAENLDHAAVEPCPYCVDQNRKTKGLVFWDGQLSLPLGGWSVIFTGKCDGCRSFAFWCWECGEKTVLPDNIIHKCFCDRTWYTERYEDEVVFWLKAEGGDVPLDRRPTR